MDAKNKDNNEIRRNRLNTLSLADNSTTVQWFIGSVCFGVSSISLDPSVSLLYKTNNY